MEDRDRIWHEKRIGVITASEVGKLMSKSGSFTKENISYLRKIERQRFLNQPAPPVFAKAMQIGIENEPYAVEWLRSNTSMHIVHCDIDFDEKIFTQTSFGLGVSPDAFGYDNEDEYLIEIKCVVGETDTNFIFSPSAKCDKVRAYVYNLHRDQMAAQLLAYPKINNIYLLKYDPQDDDDLFDLRDAMDITRGKLFKFTRSEFGGYLDEMKRKVKFSDKYLKSGRDLDDINEYWEKEMANVAPNRKGKVAYPKKEEDK